jgi:hypothetical protein
MKKLLFLTAFMLISLCSYSQDLVVQNNSSYDIIVWAAYAAPGNCGLGSDQKSVATGTTEDLIGASGTEEWMNVRANTDPTPGYYVRNNSNCSTSCDSNAAYGIKAEWNGCFEVTISDI